MKIITTDNYHVVSREKPKDTSGFVVQVEDGFVVGTVVGSTKFKDGVKIIYKTNKARSLGLKGFPDTFEVIEDRYVIGVVNE